MPLLQVILVLVIIGMVLWAVNRWVPMAPPIKTILNVVVVILVIVWLLGLSGAFWASAIHFGHGCG